MRIDAGSSGLDHNMQRVGVISHLPAVIRELGGDPQTLLSSCGLDAARISDPNASLTFEELDNLLAAASKYNETIGLLVGQRTSLSTFGPLGNLMRNACTVGQALQDFVNNQQRFVRGAVAYLISNKDTCIFGYAVYHPSFRSLNVINDGAIAAGHRMLQDLSIDAPLEVMLSRPEPVNANAYRAFFRAPVRFGCDRSALVLSSKQIESIVPGSDPQARKQASELVREYWSTAEPSVGHLVLRTLRAYVLSGKADLKTVAASLQTHPRTLGRRLSDEGQTFRAILDKVRFEVATQLLECTNMPITQIGFSLGYSEGAAFTHAFRRWAGISAQQWRSQRRGAELFTDA